MTAHEHSVTASDIATHELPPSDSPDTTIAMPDSAVPAKRVRGRPFLPGNNANPLGRPRKGHTVLDETRRAAERKAKAVGEAHVARMLREDATGNRAWAEYRDTYYGMPKQTLVLEQGESPLAELLRRRQERQALVVDAESRVLDDNATPHADDDIT